MHPGRFVPSPIMVTTVLQTTSPPIAASASASDAIDQIAARIRVRAGAPAGVVFGTGQRRLQGEGEALRAAAERRSTVAVNSGPANAGVDRASCSAVSAFNCSLTLAARRASPALFG